jgi:hypothetical protein
VAHHGSHSNAPIGFQDNVAPTLRSTKQKIGLIMVAVEMADCLLIAWPDDLLSPFAKCVLVTANKFKHLLSGL